MDKLEILLKYEDACISLSEYFVKKYFKTKFIDDCHFVAGDCTGIIDINGYYFSIQDMYQYLDNKYSVNQMFTRYDAEVDNAMRPEGKTGGFPNIQNWKLINKSSFKPK